MTRLATLSLLIGLVPGCRASAPPSSPAAAPEPAVAPIAVDDAQPADVAPAAPAEPAEPAKPAAAAAAEPEPPDPETFEEALAMLGSPGKAAQRVGFASLGQRLDDADDPIEPTRLVKRASILLSLYAAHRDHLTPSPRTGIAWRWAEPYVDHRRVAGLLLDLMGYAPTAAIKAELRAAIALPDPRLRLFAATSLLRLGEPVSAAVLEAVARDPETRGHLQDRLDRLGKAALFPRTWLTARALAEADMVRWLTFPTELGRAPDEIELMKVVADGRQDWYLFRFRTLAPHWAAKDGWMAGVAGPVPRTGPQTSHHGGTFSAFNRWDSLTPASHVAEIQSIIADWNRRADDE